MPSRYRKAAAAYLASEMSMSGILKYVVLKLLKKSYVHIASGSRLSLSSRAKWIEKYFTINPSPRIAIELAELQRLSNRHDAANRTLRRAVQRWPTDRALWHHAIIYLMRHGEPHEVSELLDCILKIDPDNDLAGFFKRLSAVYPDFVRSVLRAVAAGPSSSKPGYFIGFAVWGMRFVHLFLNYGLASLMAEGNLPEISLTHEIHLVLFTTERDRKTITSSAIYEQAQKFARVHFTLYDEALFKTSIVDDYDIAVHARFGLMSAGHQAILECARRLRFKATILGADSIVNDAFLSNIVKMADEQSGASAIVCPGIRLRARVLEIVNRIHRGIDGEVSISERAFARLLSEFMPSECFVDSKRFARFPLFLCWRVDDDGILIHNNHPLPVMIDGRYLREISFPSIDPIDGRFLVRHCTDLNRICICETSQVCLFDPAESPLLLPSKESHHFDPAEVGLWLWQFDDGLRERYFSTPVRYSFNDTLSSDWAQVERDAAAKVEQVIDFMRSLEA